MSRAGGNLGPHQRKAHHMKFDDGVCRAPVVRVKRDGPRGWKWINADAFDPRVHELYDDRAQQSPVKAKVGKSKPDADPQ